MEGHTGLYRKSKDNMIGGVAGGLADYLNIDTTLVRILFVLMVLVGGGGLIVYIIMWIVLPSDENLTIINKKTYNMDENKNQESNQNGPFQTNDPRYKKKDDGSLIAGLILIALGIIFLVIRYFPRIDFGDLWPVILIVIGIVLLRNAFVAKKQ
jgi:phage shock protein C